MNCVLDDQRDFQPRPSVLVSDESGYLAVKVNAQHFGTIWPTPDQVAVQVIDQTQLPHVFVTRTLESVRDAHSF